MTTPNRIMSDHQLEAARSCISSNDLELIINALEYVAQNEAGQTQMPELLMREDYEEWDIAQRLKAARDA